jgi:phosphoglycerate dehydrogenase-like enzyme
VEEIMNKKPKVLLGIALHEDAASLLCEKAEVIQIPGGKEDLTALIGSIEGIIAYSPPIDTLRGARKLKVISCHSVPKDLLKEAGEQGVTVTLVPSLWDTVADMTLALIFAAARNIPQAHGAIKAGLWNNNEGLKIRYSGHDVFGRTLGILGLGQIGTILAKRVQGFEMKTLYHDIHRNPEMEKKFGLEYCGLHRLLAESDILTVLVPLNDETRGMLGEEELRLMKKDAILVNTARGAIIDEEALYRVLKEKRIAAAGLDVLVREPMAADNPLLSLDNVVFTPHLGGSTKECDMVLVEDTLHILAGESPVYGVKAE